MPSLEHLSMNTGITCTLNWNTSKGNQEPIQKFERPNRKIPKYNFFLPRLRIGAPSSMKQILQRFESNQNKAKEMKINDVFCCFTSKVYSAT